MNASATPTSDNQTVLVDDGRPHFLDDAIDAHADDFGDWWLDLGRVDLPAIGW